MPATTEVGNKRINAWTDAGTVQLYIYDCPTCGVIAAITTDLEARARDNGRTIYCPNGHTWSWHETEEGRQRKRAEQAERRERWARERADRLELERRAEANRARTYKGHVTRLRNRIANGVCPVRSCRRNFANVKAHIASQHPEWAHDHPDVMT